MKHPKRNVMLGIIAVSMLFSLLVAVAVNLFMLEYTNRQAKEALQREKEYYLREAGRTKSDGTEPEENAEESEPLVIVKGLILNLDYRPFYDDIPLSSLVSRNEQKIISYCKSHPGLLNTDRVGELRIGKEKYFVSQFVLEYQWLVDGKSKKQTDRHLILLYVSVAPLQQLLRSLNLLFLILLFISALAAGLVGTRLGEKIQQSQEKLKQFFQNASHELKTPIMSIQGYAEGIKTDVVKDHEKAARIILEESEKMTDLVEELLYLSKIDSNQLVLRPGPVDVAELLYDCLKGAEVIAEKKQLSLRISFEGNLPLITADEAQLYKAFSNILSNGLRYAKKTVSIGCRYAGGKVEIDFCDDGGGIEEKDLQHIFERFYTGESGNTGVGLSLTKEIIELHKGTVTAENKKDGACFRVLLKADRPAPGPPRRGGCAEGEEKESRKKNRGAGKEKGSFRENWKLATLLSLTGFRGSALWIPFRRNCRFDRETRRRIRRIEEPGIPVLVFIAGLCGAAPAAARFLGAAAIPWALAAWAVICLFGVGPLIYYLALPGPIARGIRAPEAVSEGESAAGAVGGREETSRAAGILKKYKQSGKTGGT